MKGVLVGSGGNVNIEKFKEESLNSDMVVAVDGGLRYCIEASVIPDIVIGDLDSMFESGFEYIKNNNIEVLKYPKEKDWTDMKIAADYLVYKGCEEILIYGGTGSRLDHTLANVYLLDHILERGSKGIVVDENNEIYLVDKEMIIKGRKGEYISFIPIRNEGTIITLDGFKYPLYKKDVEYLSNLGISNETTSEKSHIKVEKGKVLVFISKD